MLDRFFRVLLNVYVKGTGVPGDGGGPITFDVVVYTIYRYLEILKLSVRCAKVLIVLIVAATF